MTRVNELPNEVIYDLYSGMDHDTLMILQKKQDCLAKSLDKVDKLKKEIDGIWLKEYNKKYQKYQKYVKNG